MANHPHLEAKLKQATDLMLAKLTSMAFAR